MIDFFIKGGLLMWPILLCSVTAAAITIHKLLQYRSVRRALSYTPQEIMIKKPAQLEPLVSALAEGLDEEEIAVIGTRQIRNLEKGLGLLSLISVISPLLGLTGTVTGMIRAFQIIAAHGSQINPTLLAGGIWEALITTAAGLFVAIPAHLACHLLEAALDDIALGMKELVTVLHARAKREMSSGVQK